MSETRLASVDWLRHGRLAQLLAVLDRDGEEARVVGGAVRNALIGAPIQEFDLATTALPDVVIRRAEDAGFRPVPTGKEHGTITVVVEGMPFEVTTLREDVETFGRRAMVRFGRDWKRDAERRDFTMNALSLSADGRVHDYVGGLADLEARRVRFIGDAGTRIAEDYLRILRFFRFHAAFGHGAPDAKGLAACIAGRTGLERLSRERVRMELLKLMVAANPLPSLVLMAEAGLLTTLLGGVPLLASFENMAKVEHAIGLSPDPVRRLGALAAFIADDAARLGERLRLSNAEQERVASMAESWWQVSPQRGEKAACALLYALKPERYADRVLLAWARSPQGAADAAWHHLVTLPERWIIPVFPLRAADFMARGIGKGPALGAAMRAAEAAWVAEDFPVDAAALARIADAAAKSASADEGSRQSG